MDIIDVLGMKLLKKNLQDIPMDQKLLVNTISPNSFTLSIKDPLMKKALQNSDLIVLDGLYFGIAPLLIKGTLVKRCAGWDCFVIFSEIVNQRNGRVFFIGSTEETLERIKKRYTIEYPNVGVDVFSPPFKDEFTQEDLVFMRNKINNFKPDIVFVGLTAPKQEKWGYLNKPFLNTHIICAIGNVFDWYAGNAQRPQKFWRVIGLEWLVRIFYRPEILKRNLGNQLLFFWYLLLILLKIKKYD
jgi:N-acetylglucosaminyldiphosphoundecaprenol N-acetyl-beta-D-mannosaminyltransferase